MFKSISADICYPFKQLLGSSPFVFTIIYLTPPLLRILYDSMFTIINNYPEAISMCICLCTLAEFVLGVYS